MNRIEFVAESSDRIDKLAAKATDLSRAYTQKLIEKGCLTVNGSTVKSNFVPKVGDNIVIELEPPKELEATPENIPLDVLYEDDSLLVINKPRGMVVHPAAGNFSGTLVNAVLYYANGSLSGIGGVLRPGIVHRIDKDTTGLLVVAKTDEAHKGLSQQLKTRTLSRVYYALLNGNIKEDCGTVNKPIGRDAKDRKKMAVTQSGKEAITDYEVIRRYNGYTLVRCKLLTGRTHQIRVHMKSLGHSVVGDKTYGIKANPFGLEGQLLHAGAISFVHPVTGEKISVECPLPEDFMKVLKKLEDN